LRIADIEAARQQPEQVVRAVENAAGLVTDDPELFARLSQAHAMANQPRQALPGLWGDLLFVASFVASFVDCIIVEYPRSSTRP
jgi:hypothetical protein